MIHRKLHRKQSMKRSKQHQANENVSSLTKDMGIFKKPKHQKILKEEKLIIEVYRRKYFEETKNMVKEKLGNDYTDEIAEEIFQKTMEKLKADGTFKSILDEYLQTKIQREREKFLGK